MSRTRKTYFKMPPPALAKKTSDQKRVIPIKPLFDTRRLLSMCAPSGGSRTAWHPEHFGRRSKVLCDRGRISDHPKVSNSSGGHAFRRYARASCAQRPLKDGLCARRGAHLSIFRQRLLTLLIHIYTHFIAFIPSPLETGARARQSDPFLHLFSQINKTAFFAFT